LSDSFDLQLNHFIDDLCVFVTLGTCPLVGLGLIRESSRLWWISKSLYCPFIRGDLIVKTELDLGDRSERFMVEIDPSLCELLNGDIGHLCGEPNFRNKSCVTCVFLLRFTYYSCSSLFLYRV
jgi:hypothetical protein